MKISAKIHGVIDYIVGFLFVFMPLALDLDSDAAPAMVFQYLGIFTVVYSMLTRYEYGLVRVVPVKVHLGLDILSGIFLLMSPWIFGFAGEIFVPYVVFGLFEVLAGSFTSNKSGFNQKHGPR